MSIKFERKYTFYHQNTLLDAFRTNSCNIIGRNPSTASPLLANQDLTPMLIRPWYLISVAARGIFHWGGKALKNWVWSEIAVAATPKSGIR